MAKDDGDVFKPLVRRGKETTGICFKGDSVEITTLEEARDGEPLRPDEDLVSLKRREDGDYNMETLYKAKKGSSKGPAQVATPQYREGWTNVFGKPKKEMLN